MIKPMQLTEGQVKRLKMAFTGAWKKNGLGGSMTINNDHTIQFVLELSSNKFITGPKNRGVEFTLYPDNLVMVNLHTMEPDDERLIGYTWSDLLYSIDKLVRVSEALDEKDEETLEEFFKAIKK